MLVGLFEVQSPREIQGDRCCAEMDIAGGGVGADGSLKYEDDQQRRSACRPKKLRDCCHHVRT